MHFISLYLIGEKHILFNSNLFQKKRIHKYAFDICLSLSR